MTVANEELAEKRIRQFIDIKVSMHRLLTASIPALAGTDGGYLNRILDWITPYDLFSVAHMTNDETRYVRLVAWLLSEDVWGSEKALCLQRNWLSRLEIVGVKDLQNPARMLLEHPVGDGRIDLILHYPGELIVGVEAKALSQEHLTGDEPQTTHYAKNLHHALGESASVPMALVYLTLSAEPAEYGEAKLESYSLLVMGLAALISRDQIDVKLRNALEMLITHFLSSDSRITNPICRYAEIERSYREGEELEIAEMLFIRETRDQLMALVGAYDG